MINFAVIGTSNITDEFISAALATDRYSLKAVYSRTYEKGSAFAKKYGCDTVYTSLDDLVNDEVITAVYVASPNALHYSQSKFLLQHGKHVICEKTITQSPEEFLELKSIADEKDLIFMDAIMSRYSPYRDAIKNAISKIGKITLARLDFSKLSSRYFKFLAGEKVNIFDMSLGAGALMDIGIYCVYAAADFFGVPENIFATAAFLDNGADGSGVAVFEYQDFNAVLTYGKTADTVIGSEILGDKGAVKIGQISQYNDAQLVCDGKDIPLGKKISKVEIMTGEANAFADYIEKLEENKQKYADATALTIDVLECMEKIKSSAGIVYPNLV